jgi:hypothetical protein
MILKFGQKRKRLYTKVSMRVKQKLVSAFALAVLATFGFAGVALAAQSSSTGYQINEVFFGSGGSLRDCSGSFCAKLSAGESAVGNIRGGDFQAQAGFNTDRTPSLEFVVSNTNQDIGILTSTTTKTANATFSVKSYLAGGYVVNQTSPGPTNGSFVLSGLTTPSASAVGTEQFGINLAANTAPANFGAAPSQSPDSTFGFGYAKNGYNTPNQYKYVQNDTIAQSDVSSGTTNYTLSYIFNVSNLTAGGTYTLRHVLVATSTY